MEAHFEDLYNEATGPNANKYVWDDSKLAVFLGYASPRTLQAARAKEKVTINYVRRGKSCYTRPADALAALEATLNSGKRKAG